MKIWFLCNIKPQNFISDQLLCSLQPRIPVCFWSLYSDKRLHWLKHDFGRIKKYALSVTSFWHIWIWQCKNDIFFVNVSEFGTFNLEEIYVHHCNSSLNFTSTFFKLKGYALFRTYLRFYLIYHFFLGLPSIKFREI